MKVELLWWEGCPSYPETLEDLTRVLRDEGVDAEVDLVEVESDEQAHRERFPGSPTIRLDGEDAIAGGPGRAVLADLPHLSPARRPRLADARSRGHPRSGEESQ